MALITISLHNRLSAYLQLFSNRREVSTASLNHHSDMVRKVEGAVEAVGKQEQGILRDRSRSDEGKATALGTMATGAASTFAFLERVVTRHDEERSAAKATLFTVNPPAAAGTDISLQFHFGNEIRDALRGLDQQARDVAFLKASEVDLDDDPDAVQAHRDARLWAVLQTPGGHGVTPDIFRRAMDERWRRLRPAVFAEFQQATLLHDSLSALRDSLVGWLRGLGGDPVKIHAQLGGPEPTTAQIATKMVAA
jgi:hypothetical protein